MITIVFELACFLIFASAVMCVIPEPEKPYTPRERPAFNQKIWEPTQEVFEKHQLSCRWMKPSKPSARPPIPPIHAV
ncbi:hypothetical protein L5515_008908 [Caenorhabditis briggsae]|uniref:Uncharacterized protein n=1 Tax=Caenorhabditis briggsae TaxID=6238 RepID=A0AAE9JLK5_CAEBR|nr:hypothetical protein L3Y34_009078 [Caenorhabditis briggsae]UMM36987.1 hypothetical protein L5515_008908 [Caenorhabditis briggsae]